jgi:hypothetical protein
VVTDNPRPGRLASLQIESNGQWRTISTPKPMTASGSANWTLTELPPFSATYRVLLQEWQASPARASSSVSFQAGTGLPLLELSTVNEQPVVDKVNYVPGEIRVAGTHRVSMRIKGRGNSTWTRPKKPYRLKLDSSTGLLNMPADRDWVLLANYLDRSYLRNWAALKLASQSRLKWTPRSEFVEVTLNGVDLGNYLLTEQVEQGPHKLALPAGSLLLEIDQRFQEQGEPGFVSSHQVPITYKDPDELSPQMEQDLEEAVADFESALWGPDFADPVVGYSAHIADLDTFADWYLVNEFFKNLDSPFYSSVYFTWQPGSGFSMGPVWDFDLSSGNTFSSYCCVDPTGWWLRGDPSIQRPLHSQHWFVRMLQDPAFQALVRSRWQQMRPFVTELLANVEQQISLIGTSTMLDWSTWQVSPVPPRPVIATTPSGEAAHFLSWLHSRATWMDGQFS